MGIKKKMGEIATQVFAPKENSDYATITTFGSLGVASGDSMIALGCGFVIYAGTRIYRGINYGTDYFADYLKIPKEK